MFRKVFTLILLGTFTFACSLFNLAGEYGNVKSYSPNDEEMNAAIQQARDTLPLFIAELQDPAASQTQFSVKARIPYNNEGGAEHLWIDNVTCQNDQFTGILANEPVYVKGYHLGDTMVVDMEDVSDWMIIADRKLIGGFTIHVFFDHMTESEISEFETGTGYTVEAEPVLP